MAINYGITLKRLAAEKVNLYYIGAYRMRVEASNARGEGLDPYVFIYKRGTLNPYTGEYCDEYQAVCGPADMAEIPALAPVEDQAWPFYRLSYIELDFRSEETAMAAWDIIQTEVAILVEGMGGLTNLVEQEELVFADSETA